MTTVSRTTWRFWVSFFRRTWRNISLARKLLFTGFVLLMVVAGTLMTTTYVSAEDALRTQMHRQVRNELRVFERLYAIRAGIAPTDAPKLDAIVARHAADEMVTLMGGFSAIFMNDTPLASAGLEGLPPGVHLRLPGTLLTPDMPEAFITATFHDVPYVIALRSMHSSDGREVVTFVRGIPKKEISDMLQKHAWGIFSISGTVMLLAVVALAWMSNELVAPLRRLAHASRYLLENGEHPDGNPHPDGKDEVGRLAAEFKAIAERLAEQKAALEEKDRARGHLLEKLITAQEDERRRISRELHDQTGQSLTTLLVGLKVLQKAHSMEDMLARSEDLMSLVHQTLDEVHRLSVQLRPTLLDDLGLVAALRAQALEFEAAHGVKVEVRISGLEHRLSPVLETSLYRVVQEALTNVGKYAHASNAVVSLTCANHSLLAEVMDDGVGFNLALASKPGARESLGLLGMRERAVLLGGDLIVLSEPGAGTRVRWSIPLPTGEPLHA